MLFGYMNVASLGLIFAISLLDTSTMIILLTKRLYFNPHNNVQVGKNYPLATGKDTVKSHFLQIASE